MPTQARMRRREQAGVNAGQRALCDPIRLGLDHASLVVVKLSHTREAALSAFDAAVRAVPEVGRCHLIAGRFDCLL